MVSLRFVFSTFSAEGSLICGPRSTLKTVVVMKKINSRKAISDMDAAGISGFDLVFFCSCTADPLTYLQRDALEVGLLYLVEDVYHHLVSRLLADLEDQGQFAVLDLRG